MVNISLDATKPHNLKRYQLFTQMLWYVGSSKQKKCNNYLHIKFKYPVVTWAREQRQGKKKIWIPVLIKSGNYILLDH